MPYCSARLSASPRTTFHIDSSSKTHSLSRSPALKGRATATAHPLVPPPPRQVSEIDKSRILGYGPELDDSHPGFGDADFKRRRVAIAHLADEYVDGTPIPRVEYTEAERETWARILRELRVLHPRGACRAYLDEFPKCGFSEDFVPQLADVDARLEAATGWRIRPAPGLLHPRAFLNGLAFGVFHSTQYMRHHSDPTYTPEPDLCHEMLGHIPMLMDQDFADTVRAIGDASLAASDEEIWHLVKVYWYTVEFGVVREEIERYPKLGLNELLAEFPPASPDDDDDGVWVQEESDCRGEKIYEYRAFGAGILSSVAEMENIIHSAANGGDRAIEFSRIDPYVKQPRMSYNEGRGTGAHPLYVCGSV